MKREMATRVLMGIRKVRLAKPREARMNGEIVKALFGRALA
jgi:hypothetical protein